MNDKDKAMLHLIAIVLGEYPKDDDRYVIALAAALAFFPDEDWSDYK